jgi:hypothetical protein
MKTLFYTFLFSLSVMALNAQQMEINVKTDPNAEIAPGVYLSENFGGGNKSTWDIQSSFNATQSGGGVGQAAVAFINNEFWASKWASDTLIRYTTSGTLISKFTIAGLNGTRAITSDGTYLYIANNSNTIYKVNPNTQQIVAPNITSSASVTSRFLTYDPTLNSGAGGFWTGNFNTDIVAISMSGAVLTSIPAATHGLGGMYGAAVDNVSTGGPYLWIFHQNGVSSQAQINALQLPAGTQTVYLRDVMPDFSTIHSLTSGLAGGLFLTTAYISGETSLMGLIQGTPDNVVFSYELSLGASIEDVEVLDVKPEKGYTMIPKSQIFEEVFKIQARNSSTLQVDTLYADIEYYYNGGLTDSETIFVNGVGSGATVTMTSSVFLPDAGTGQYEVFVSVRPNAAIVDSNPANDTLSFSFEVTDTIFARDNNISTGWGYSVSSTDWAYAVTLFEITSDDTIAGVWIRIETPVQGDTTFAVLYNYDSMPSTQIALGEVVIIDGTINEYFLPFAGNVPLGSGTYLFGCYEGTNTTIGLSQSNDIFTPGTNYFYIGSSSTWQGSGIQTARFIRPVFKYHSDVSLVEHTLLSVNIYPVPANDQITFDFGATLLTDVAITVFDMRGRMVKNDVFSGSNSFNMAVNDLNKGVYTVSIIIGSQKLVRKVIVW